MGKIDIILGNENEFEALGDNILPPLAVKTLGAGGVDVYQHGKWQHFQALPVSKLVNTAGAGDAFAGGFLLGYQELCLLKKPLKSDNYALLIVLQQAGSRVHVDLRENGK